MEHPRSKQNNAYSEPRIPSLRLVLPQSDTEYEGDYLLFRGELHVENYMGTA
jgi:hypothetical protein